MPDYQRLSKTIAFALRHKPWLYELELDAEGWTTVESLLAALAESRHDWQALTEADLHKMIRRADKQRFEIRDGRIRALYGHSLANSVHKTPTIPPPKLFHGTTQHALTQILAEGLHPMRRQFVHFSMDLSLAQAVAQRHSQQTVMLSIAAERAYTKGVQFYRGNEKVWLADFVPPEFIEVMSV
jgi:putative RNA 2'-phosphotransferase